MLSIDSECQQEKTNAVKCVRNPIQSESESKWESNLYICSELTQSEPQEVPIITLLLNTGNEYPIIQKDVDRWIELYPAVDIIQELKEMKEWCINNPRKRKTKDGIKRFISSWLAREQDKGGTLGYKQTYNRAAGSLKVEQFAEEAREWANNE